jgi:hypothetical protein
MKPTDDAPQEEWNNYNELVEAYEANERNHVKQMISESEYALHNLIGDGFYIRCGMIDLGPDKDCSLTKKHFGYFVEIHIQCLKTIYTISHGYIFY